MAAERANFGVRVLLYKFLMGPALAVTVCDATEPMLIIDGAVEVESFNRISRPCASFVRRCGPRAVECRIGLLDVWVVVVEAMLRPSRERVVTPAVCEQVLRATFGCCRSSGFVQGGGLVARC